MTFYLLGLLGLLAAGVAEYLYRRRTRVPTLQGACRLCGRRVPLSADLRAFAHSAPGEPEHRTCMGSYLHPQDGTVAEAPRGDWP